MEIAVLGASGRIGQRITLEALIRNPERFPMDLFSPSEHIAPTDVLGSIASVLTN